MAGVGGVLSPTTLPSSNAVAGKVFFGTTDNPPAGGVLATVTFAKPFPSQPIVQLTAATAATVDLGLLVSETTTGFQIRARNALPVNQPATTYQVNYTVVG